MTTDLEGRLREALHDDAQRARLVNPDRPPASDIVSMTDTPSRARSVGRGVVFAAAAIVVALAAVGIAIRNENPSRVATEPTPTIAPPDKGCPFTAEEVSAAIGETVTGPESSTNCSFGPGPFPSVGFAYLPASACTPESLRDADGGEYSDAVDGLGVYAYSRNYSLGNSLIVCDGDQPFEVVVDGIQGDDLAAAITLAKRVLNGAVDNSSTTLAQGKDVEFIGDATLGDQNAEHQRRGEGRRGDRRVALRQRRVTNGYEIKTG